MNILSITPGHNGSIAFLKDGELLYYSEEERHSKVKYDGNPFRAMLLILTKYKIDKFVIANGSEPEDFKLHWIYDDVFTGFVKKFSPDVEMIYLGEEHHRNHAAAGFYGSGFKTAVAIVVDGAGSLVIKTDYNNKHYEFWETESIFNCSYPNNINPIYKKLSCNHGFNVVEGYNEYSSNTSITKTYEAITEYLGFGGIEAGKTMGLSPYGTEDDNLPDFFIDGKGNRNVFINQYPQTAAININNFPYLKLNRHPHVWHKDFSQITNVEKNIAYKIQKETENQMFELIQKAIDLSGETNVVISGGYGLNCVANYKYLKKFPNINFYIDPIAHDGGNAIGAAKYVWYNETKDTTIRPTKSLYLSFEPDYSKIDLSDDFVMVDTNYDDIADLIINGNIVTLFQGRSEGGPRALGNRSILFDPRVKNGKDIVNEVKHREWFRPFAGSVLEEHAHEYFDMATLKSSPFMMYAVDVLPEKLDIIPSITHVDGTCRVQTVNIEQNKHYYELINAFYKKTNVPILFNTSFNLAGDPLVETIEDALNTLRKSEIKYLYLPELGKLIKKR